MKDDTKINEIVGIEDNKKSLVGFEYGECNVICSDCLAKAEKAMGKGFMDVLMENFQDSAEYDDVTPIVKGYAETWEKDREEDYDNLKKVALENYEYFHKDDKVKTVPTDDELEELIDDCVFGRNYYECDNCGQDLEDVKNPR